MKKIKSVTTKIFTKETNEEYTAAYSEFDINGNEIVAIDNDYDGTENAKNVSHYNKDNRCTKLEVYTSGELSETHDFSYREDGKIVSEIITYADESKSIKNYDYQDLKTVITTVDEDGEQEELEILILDSDGNIIEKTVSDYENTVTLHQKAEYQNGKIAKRVDFDSNGAEIHHRLFTYNDNGLINSIKILSPKNEIMDSSVYGYDNQNREIFRSIGTRAKTETVYNDVELTVIQTTSTTSGQILSSTISVFDQEKNPISEEDFATIKKFEYQYFDEN